VAIKKTELPSTWNLRRTITSAEVSGDPESLKDLQDLLEQTPSRDVILPSLEEIQDQAETFLRLYLIQELGGSKRIPESDFRAVQVAGIAYVVRGRIERAWKEINKKSQETLSQEAKRELINDLRRVERASDACNMLHCLSVIRGQMKKWLCRSRRISGRISRNWRMSASGCELRNARRG
jgi:hypothetical protein